MADVGLVGFPSAGKSSLVSVLSAAQPKIADYPFTTLEPNLGVVTAGAEIFTVADVPGLIPGASQGKGLGLEFLRHIERCAVLVHVVDCATFESGRDPVSDIEALEAELAQYTPSLSDDLADRPRLVVLNKIDVPEARELAEFVQADLEEAGYRVFPISTASREGLNALRYAMAEVVASDRAARPAKVAQRIIVRPAAFDEEQFKVGVDPEVDGGFVVSGTRPERWILQTDFNNDEAVGYLADRLARLGVEDKLSKLGAKPGAPVQIGNISFDWEPTTLAGVNLEPIERGASTLASTRRSGSAPPIAGTAPIASWPRGRGPRIGRYRHRCAARPAVADRRRSGCLGRRRLGEDIVGEPGAGPGRRGVRSKSSSDDGAGRACPRPSRAAAVGAQPFGDQGRDRRCQDHRRQGGIVVVDHLGRRTGSGPPRRPCRFARDSGDGRLLAGAGVLRRHCRRPGAAGVEASPARSAPQQAAASVGQQLLAQRYAGSFARHGLRVGQVLLTSDDVVRRAHYRNAQRTFAKLLSFGVVPVVNENDTVATEEIRFGDNDRLAALVAHLVGADALVLLSDVDALYTGDPRLPMSRRIDQVDRPDELSDIDIAASSSDVSTGGMSSKLAAAMMATGAGIPVLLASAADAAAALAGGPSASAEQIPLVGTAFAPESRRTGARLFWLRHAASSSGTLRLDAGAVAAVVGRRKSLLPAGIIGATGDFESGDVVDLVGPDGVTVARGFVGHDAADLPAIVGKSLSDLPEELRHEVVHADDLIAVTNAAGGLG